MYLSSKCCDILPHNCTSTTDYILVSLHHMHPVFTLCCCTGLHLIAEGLEDLRDALVQCDETVIVKDLTKFIEALISCTTGKWKWCSQ